MVHCSLRGMDIRGFTKQRSTVARACRSSHDASLQNQCELSSHSDPLTKSIQDEDTFHLRVAAHLLLKWLLPKLRCGGPACL